jgi:O-methyltransferase
MATLLDLEPTVEGAVFDLPGVVARAVHHERLRALGGDAFVEVPAGFDTYLLVNVLHDWNDADATRILGRVAEAMGRAARVIVVDSARTTVPRDDMAVSADILMAALTNGGQERDADAFAALGRACGLELRRTMRLASGDRAHEFTPAG